MSVGIYCNLNELFQIVVIDNMAKHNDMNHSSVKSEALAVDYMTNHNSWDQS
jgi:hypothetical protein